MKQSSQSTGSTATAERGEQQQQSVIEQYRNQHRQLVRIPFLGRQVLLHRSKAHGDGLTAACIFSVRDHDRQIVDLTAYDKQGNPYTVTDCHFGPGTDQWTWNQQADLAMFGPELMATADGEGADVSRQTAGRALGYSGNTRT